MTHVALAEAYRDWLVEQRLPAVAERVSQYLRLSSVGATLELPGPVGERNLYVLKPRGRVAALAADTVTAMLQLGAILATGNRALIQDRSPAAQLLAGLPRDIATRVDCVPSWQNAGAIDALLYAGDRDGLLAICAEVARLDGPIVGVQGVSSAGFAAGAEDYALEQLLAEVTISTNTAAAGGNAKLMTIG
jgi:RHH-type proline utilization regulon transcriptional repressor/proline dehydrogenase/delta 1-pyrroline-5-carboxylate dehydrogenase